jgi:hypothetical protein
VLIERSVEGPVPLELHALVEPGRVTVTLDVHAPRLTGWILGHELGKELALLRELVEGAVVGTGV